MRRAHALAVLCACLACLACLALAACKGAPSSHVLGSGNPAGLLGTSGNPLYVTVLDDGGEEDAGGGNPAYLLGTSGNPLFENLLYAGPPTLVTWTNVDAGGSLAVPGGATTTKITVDSTGDAAAGLSIPGADAAVNGQTIIVSLRGASADAGGVTLTPGGGANMADPNNPGGFTGVATPATIHTPGQVFGVTYYAAGTEWLRER